MLSVPHNGQAMVTRPTVVLEATTGVFIAGPSFLPRPNYVPCPNLSDTCLAGTPICRPVTLVPIWAIHARQGRVSGFTPHRADEMAVGRSRLAAVLLVLVLGAPGEPADVECVTACLAHQPGERGAIVS
jgi:hypothetical protein